jgi:mRNA interferase MazF
VLVCPLTSVLRDTPAFRLTVQPTPENGLRLASQLMLDKLSPAPRAKCGPVIGRLDDDDMAELTRRVLALLGAARS